MDTEQFAKEFRKRHSFGGEDVGVLKSKFPHISFHNIPDAWVLGVDEFLTRVDPKAVAAIRQACGFFYVSVFDLKLGDAFWDQVEIIERKLYGLDKDLHKSLERSP